MSAIRTIVSPPALSWSRSLTRIFSKTQLKNRMTNQLILITCHCSISKYFVTLKTRNELYRTFLTKAHWNTHLLRNQVTPSLTLICSCFIHANKHKPKYILLSRQSYTCKQTHIHKIDTRHAGRREHTDKFSYQQMHSIHIDTHRIRTYRYRNKRAYTRAYIEFHLYTQTGICILFKFKIHI